MRHVPAGILFLLLFLSACDHGLAPPDGPCGVEQGMCGAVTLQGAWPDSTDFVRIVVFRGLPTSADDLFANIAADVTVPSGSARFEYDIPLASGTYPWIVIVWKRIGLPTAENLREVGSYYAGGDSTRFGVVEISPGEVVGGVDIVADFGRMRTVEQVLGAAPGGGS